ncbi:MAG: hypothetical protein M1467_04410 [Deltaproteobacteria bacterium]|nr:hypothetical protein [Deltaproteobacteria bacterium]
MGDYRIIPSDDTLQIQAGRDTISRIVNLDDKDIKEFDMALIKKNNRFFVRKLIGNKFTGSKEYPDFNSAGITVIGKVITAVRLRKL